MLRRSFFGFLPALLSFFGLKTLGIKMLAYHFVGDTLRDGKPIPQDGEWLVHEGEVEICKSGLHASIEPFDALLYAPGATLCLVEVEDIVKQQKDKLVCRKRKIVKRIDIQEHLRRFAADFALSVSHLWEMPDIVREYLTTLDESKREEARKTAYDTSHTVYYADAAYYASSAEAADAAAFATGAYFATTATCRVAAANNKFNEMVYNLFKE